MTVEQQQVLALLNDYKAAVAKAVLLLNAKYAQDKGFLRQAERSGYLDKSGQQHYSLHGMGCLVTTPEFEVDFDFGWKGRCDGVDPGFLHHFLRKNAAVKEKYPLLISGAQAGQYVQGAEQVERVLHELAGAGMVANNVCPFNERTYYLTADIQDPAPPTTSWGKA
jgi:hypothetical protein